MRNPSSRPCAARTRRCRPVRGVQLAIEFGYSRGGTLAYFAAYDMNRGQLMGAIAEKTGIVPFMELADQVMSTEPYAWAHRVFWLVDNGSWHNGARPWLGCARPGPPRPWCTCRCMPPG
ncbi:MAG: hypothetical protein ABI563_11905 [Specibacter sp.]